MPCFRAPAGRVRSCPSWDTGQAGTCRHRLPPAPICQPRQNSVPSPVANGHEDVMGDLDPAAIERLLHDGARRRGETVDAYRDFIQTTAGRAGVSFEKALQLANYFETLPPGERKAM